MSRKRLTVCVRSIPPGQGLAVTTFVGCLIGAAVLGLFDPDSWLNMQEYGLFQNIQASVLGVAFGVTLLTLFRTEGEERTFWIFVLGFAFFFFWRELDLDQEFFEDRMFSWAYLFRDSVPVRNKLILGIPSILFVVLWGGHVVLKAWVIVQTVRDRIQTVDFGWAGCTLLFFGLAQIWDKTTAFQRDWGIQIYDRATKDPYIEEAFELLGGVAFLILIVTLRNRPLRQVDESVRD